MLNLLAIENHKDILTSKRTSAINDLKLLKNTEIRSVFAPHISFIQSLYRCIEHSISVMDVSIIVFPLIIPVHCPGLSVMGPGEEDGQPQDRSRESSDTRRENTLRRP